MKILFASQNTGKIGEAKTLFQDLAEIEIVSPDEVGLGGVDVDENGNTYQQNALLKAKQFSRISGMTCIADDSGLSVTALDGFPGVKSKRFAGIEKVDDRFSIIIDLLHNKDRSAEFITALCYADDKRKVFHCVEGRLAGSISFEEKGDDGFEYDKIFIPQGYSQTLAELGMEVKNTISARRKALEKLKKFLNTTVKKKYRSL